MSRSKLTLLVAFALAFQASLSTVGAQPQDGTVRTTPTVQDGTTDGSADGTADATADGSADGADGAADGTTDGTVANGTVNGTVANGTVNGTVANGTVGTTSSDPALPTFLDTTDRRIQDDRPPPTPSQLAALAEMEAEVGRFTQTGESYRQTVVSLVRREYLRQRRGRDQWFARQIREEERMLNEARERAITEFERFIARYPDDPTYTPDAMFRLGELYYERSAIAFQDAYDEANRRRDAGEEEIEIPDTPNFQDTIDIYRRLVTAFPNYRRLDGVFYLIGYCLNEMGRPEEALRAWLSLVCYNQYQYDPNAFAAEQAAEADAMAEDDAAAEAPPASPALIPAADVLGQAADGTFTNPYATCTPVSEEAEFVSETWFRIGEYHFDDYGSEHALDMAIAAYNQILRNPEDRNFNLALYKVAWAYYRASRYPEAIRHFGMLVQWSDDERARTGEAGSQLRPEALQYLGIAFAYDDWNENGLSDTMESMPDGITRIQDPNLVPQDRAWTPEVYYELGRVYFEEAKYPEAIRVWRLLLSRWPNFRMAPQITNEISTAHQRQNQFEDALRVDSELAGYLSGSDWYNNNLDNPSELSQAERLAENALIRTAISEHTQAQRVRRQSVEAANAGDAAQALTLFEQAKQHYLRAATAYREYLRRYPNNPQAYELQFNLADALFWSAQYEEAAVEYAAVRDSNLDDSHLSEAAKMVVEATKEIVDQAIRSGSLQAREAPPEPQGTPPRVTPEQMPELLQRMAQARELYIARVSDRQDREGVRAAYDYNNAVLLYQYGYWPQAKERFERIFDERCSGPYADQTGLVAWESLREMAIAYNDTAEIERLARALSERRCTFEPNGEACPATQQDLDAFCAQTDNRNHRCCLAQADLTAIEFQRAVQTFAEAEAAQGDERTRLFEQAATMLVEAVNRTPGHPQAPIALEKAAIALEQTQRFDSARQIYQRIIDEVGPRQGEDDTETQSLNRIVANAYFRVAQTAARGFAFDEAVANYRVLVDSPRFRGSRDERIGVFRRDALANTAILLEQLQRYNDAITYYRQIIDSSDASGDDKRTAAYRIAEIAFKREQWTPAIREMQGFIQRYRSDSAAGELVVQAYWRIAQARQKLNQTRDYRTALQDVVRAFASSGQAPGSIAAEYAANAQFLITNETVAEFETFTINPGRPATLEAYVQALVSQINDGSRRASSYADGFNAVVQYRRPQWTIAAFVQRGKVYETLARAILNAPFVMPADLQRQLSRVGADAREEIRIQVEDRIRMTLDEQVRPVECLAVAEYALASRAARVGSFDTEYSRAALDRLQAYGDERIAECIAARQAQDASFQAYNPGEFARAPRGQTLDIEADITPPALAQ
ncbi:MAG: tetratricopeptide repeat protein [Sandaracinus sp.]|nr:tetratricopeptide repeat protein [Sandaracinus sp.]